MISDGIVTSPPLPSLVRGALREAHPASQTSSLKREHSCSMCVMLRGQVLSEARMGPRRWPPLSQIFPSPFGPRGQLGALLGPST